MATPVDTTTIPQAATATIPIVVAVTVAILIVDTIPTHTTVDTTLIPTTAIHMLIHTLAPLEPSLVQLEQLELVAL